MPNSPHSLDLSVDSLRSYLSDLLPDSQVSATSVDSMHQALLLLRTKHVMAAFAFSNGEMRKSYDALYRSFKSFYSKQRGQWDALDLAFVFCVRPDATNLDRFCSSVETDVYFCRKFVIPLALPLSAALARLPFLPLAPSQGKSLRPPSAQTFLHQCGVSAVLAKFLVVQHTRSPDGIVEDCTSEKFGAPMKLTGDVTPLGVQSDVVTDPIRLETITIKNFRAYRKPQTFTIGADVTVLYGPNGFGKTSFFDAVDFAVTGGIGRLNSSKEAHFVKMVRHLDSNLDESMVSVSFQRDSEVRKITRNVRERKQALLDGQYADRKTILAELTGGDIPATDRVENFVDLFRATHLFNQENQELTKNFRDDCQLPAQLVSRMLAFQDYANAVQKSAKVQELLRNGIVEANQIVRELSKEIADEKRELDRLGHAAEAHTNVEALDAEIEALRGKLIDAGFDVASGKLDATTVRGWRASIEARHAQSQSLGVRLADLARAAAGLPRMHADLASLKQKVGQDERALAAAVEKRIAATLVLQRAEQRLAEMSAACVASQARSALFEWVRSTKPVYALLIDKQKVLNDELKIANETLAQFRAGEETAANAVRAQERNAEIAAEQLRTRRMGAQARSELLEWARNTKSVYAQLIENQRTLNDAVNRRADILSQHRAAEEKAVDTLRMQETRAEVVADQLRTKRAEFAKVVSLNESAASWQINRTRLVAIVESEHSALNSLDGLKAEDRELSPQITTVAALEARLSRQIAEIDKNQTELKTLLSQLQGHVQTKTCPLCGTDHGSRDELIRRIQVHLTADAASAARADIAGVRERAKHLAENVAANSQKQQTTVAQLAGLKNERTRLDAEISRFAYSAADLGIVIEDSVPTPTEQLRARHIRLQEEIRNLNGQIEGTQVAVDAARTTLANAKHLAATTSAELDDLKAALARVQAEANQLMNDPRLIHVSLDVDHEEVARIERLKFAEEIGELNRLMEDTRVGADAAHAGLANIKHLVLAKSTQVVELRSALARVQDEARQLRDDPRLTQIALEVDDEFLARTDRLNGDQLIEFKAAAAKAQTEAEQKKLEMSLLRQEAASLKARLPTLRAQLANLQNTVTQIAARLQESKLPADASEEMLLSMISDESHLQAQLLVLRDSTSNIELAIDAATTAAALTQLLQNVRSKERAVAIAARKRDQYQPWLNYFDELSRLVSSQQNEAIADFTREYGPRTSVIQRRLRSVYGFDDIEIRSHDSAITVRVKRHGEELRPTDYFSQSQQQTLLLGLFLTACISQSWSGFLPVLLDDPVTHFDDLNTYAFLDLIVGLIESGCRKTQFIISTCDEKLLQLARQKFRHLGERAMFYRFTAIDPEGPSIEKVSFS